ncbi:MAG TPA: rhodanese-like domain-containing protein [Phycisphaerae bacterium]|nr:rhodanese-like domain-containing protein [Phycisphaerae bacterium]
MTDFQRIRPADLRSRLAQGNGLNLIDVRNLDEFERVHVAGATCVPLSQLLHRASAWDPTLPVVLICKQGPRSEEAARQLCAAGFGDVAVVDGATERCVQERLPVVRGRRRLSIQQQTQLVIGLMVVAGLVGAHWFAPVILLSWLGGVGLMAAGMTGSCPMARAIASLPWNRARPAGTSGCDRPSCTR